VFSDWARVITKIKIDLDWNILRISKIVRRLLIEILIIAVVIAFGWNKPFKDQVAQAYANINSAFDSLAR